MLISLCSRLTLTGGHINPAVTVGLAVLGKHPWKKVWHYLVGQYLGAFVAAAVVYLKYVILIAPLCSISRYCLFTLIQLL